MDCLLLCQEPSCYIAPCFSYLLIFQHCDQIPEKNNLSWGIIYFWLMVSEVSTHDHLLCWFWDLRQSIMTAGTCCRGCSLMRDRNERENVEREMEGGRGRRREGEGEREREGRRQRGKRIIMASYAPSPNISRTSPSGTTTWEPSA